MRCTDLTNPWGNSNLPAIPSTRRMPTVVVEDLVQRGDEGAWWSSPEASESREFMAGVQWRAARKPSVGGAMRSPQCDNLFKRFHGTEIPARAQTA